MGRKTKCTRKTNEFRCRNLSPCAREYISERAAMATLERGYVVSESAIFAEIVNEKMKTENFNCSP
jgi:hypothetical protein